MSPSVTSGLLGGLLATGLASTVFAVAGRPRPLPAARIWARYVADDGRPADVVVPGIALHVVAGTAAGAVFGALVGLGNGPDGPLPPLWIVAGGVGYGLVLGGLHCWGVLGAALGVDIDRELVAEFLVLHVVYGTVLGGWVALEFPATLAGTPG